jgi:hypothetical protein
VLAPAPKLGAALPLAAARSVKKKRGRDGARCAEQGAAARRPAGRRGRDGSMVGHGVDKIVLDWS